MNSGLKMVWKWVASGGLVALLGWSAATAAQAANYQLSDLKDTFALSLTAVVVGVDTNQAPAMQVVSRVGVFKADGKGVLAGRCIATLDDGESVLVSDYNLTGTYTVDKDGTGQLILDAPPGPEIISCRNGESNPAVGCLEALQQEHYSFVLSGGKKTMSAALMQTDTPAGRQRAYLRGTITTQDVKGGGGGGGGGLPFPF